MATLKDIREWFPGFWEVGSGNFVVACSSARRLTFVATEEAARELKNESCGMGCNRYDQPHRGFRVEPAPAPAGAKLSASWKAMVADERT